MTTFLLVRHALADPVGRSIAGRRPGVHLNETGRAQAEALAGRLADIELTAIWSSPLERARETAAPLARRAGVPVQVSEALTELDFGDWTGRAVAELEEEAGWPEFNAFRSGTPVPGGPLMGAEQARMVAELVRLRDAHPEGRVAVVSHGDPIRAVLAWFLGVPLDLAQRLEIEPASVSGLILERWGPRVLFVNHTGEVRIG